MTTKNYAELTRIEYSLKEGTKTVYVETDRETYQIPERHYNNIIDGMRFFRRLGGSETATRSYTSRGFKVVKLVSKSPDRQTKIVRVFNFDI